MVSVAADFRGQIIQLAIKQVEFFQRGEQGFERGKPAKAETGRQVERLERGEACQRERSLSFSHPERLSDWSEVRPANSGGSRVNISSPNSSSSHPLRANTRRPSPSTSGRSRLGRKF